MKSVTSVAICSCRSVGANVGLLSGGTASAAAGTRPPAQAPASTNAVANKPVLILFIIPDPSSIPTQRRHLRPAEARLECPDPPIKGKRHTFATLDKPYAATHHNHRHRPRLASEFRPLVGSFGLFMAMTVVAGASFYAQLKRLWWRWPAQALMWADVLFTGWFYWP